MKFSVKNEMIVKHEGIEYSIRVEIDETWEEGYQLAASIYEGDIPRAVVMEHGSHFRPDWVIEREAGLKIVSLAIQFALTTGEQRKMLRDLQRG